MEAFEKKTGEEWDYDNEKTYETYSNEEGWKNEISRSVLSEPEYFSFNKKR